MMKADVFLKDKDDGGSGDASQGPQTLGTYCHLQKYFVDTKGARHLTDEVTARVCMTEQELETDGDWDSGCMVGQRLGEVENLQTVDLQSRKKDQRMNAKEEPVLLFCQVTEKIRVKCLL